jgi:myxalamid-type nonribosomal peptide synthetase MxaA
LWIDERKWSIDFSESCRMQVLKHLGCQPIITRPINLEELKLNDRSSLQSKINYILDKAPHVEPSTETEERIYLIWKNLLEIEQFGVHDNFFQLGGQSLMTTVMLSEIQQVFNTEISIEELLSNLTIASLAELVEWKLDGGNTKNLKNRISITVDLQEEVNLYKDLSKVTSYKLNTFKMNAIFLTGASGFLGAQLLSDLLMSTNANVYCLVRADNVDMGFYKIKNALNKYKLWKASFKDRILIICGTLDKPLLGLSQSDFNHLGKNIDAIYHNGASVNFVYSYNQLKNTNVLGTREIIRLASEHKTKPIHYISTVGVLDRTLPNIEESLNIKLHSNMGSGYEQSKWVAEQLLNIASEQGIPIAIYRPSRVVGHSRTGIANSDDLFCRMIKGMIEFGKAPIEAGYDNMVPVDYASRMIIEASLNIKSLGKAFHVVNPNWHRIDEVVNFTVDQGYQLDLLPYDRWLSALTEHVKTNMSNPLTLLMPVLRRLNPIDDPTISMVIPIESIQLRSVIGDELVENVPTTEDICSVYFDFFYESGFLTKAIGSPEDLSVDCA